MIIYKIRHATTGLYSTGGSSPRWTKKGKVWTNIGHVKSHLRQVFPHYYTNKEWSNTVKKMKDWVLVSYELKEELLSQVAIEDFATEIMNEEENKKQKREDHDKKMADLKKKTLDSLSPDQKKALGFYE